MSPTIRGTLRTLWRQLPFFVWLVALWMLLWGQFTVLAAVTGILVAIFATRVFRLPPIELSGRLNLWYLFVFVVTFLAALVRGSLLVSWQVLNPRRYPGTAIIGVQMRSHDDLIMTHVGVTASLIPGSLVVDTDRDRHIIYLHVIGVHSDADVESQRHAVERWEARIVRALGSREQVARLKESAGASAPAGGGARR